METLILENYMGAKDCGVLKNVS